MRLIQCLSIVAVTGAVAFSQTVRINGIVKDAQTNTPLSGVETRLLKKGIADTTDNSGAFTLEWTPQGVLGGRNTPGSTTRPFIASRGAITFSVAGSQTVMIEAFSIQGKSVFSFNRTFPAGVHTVFSRLPSGFYLWKITVGGRSQTIAGVITGKSNSALDQGNPATEGNNLASLLKKTQSNVLNDTLLLSKTGFVARKIPLSKTVSDTTLYLSSAGSMSRWKGVYEGKYGPDTNTLLGTWHVVVDSAGAIQGYGDNGLFTITGTVGVNGSVTMGGTWRGTAKTASFAGGITAANGAVSGTILTGDGSTGIFRGARISSQLIEISGTVTIPASQTGKAYSVILDNDWNGGNGWLTCFLGTLDSAKSFHFNLSYLPGTYYLYCMADLNGDGQPSFGDYMGAYGVTKYPFLPDKPNVNIAENGQKVYDITMSTYSATDTIVNGDFSLGAAYWMVNLENGATAQCVVDNGTMHITIGSIGPNDYDVRLNYFGGLSLKQGKTYRLSFDAWASGAKKVRPDINGMDGAVFTHFFSFAPIDLSTQKQHFSVSGTMGSPTTDNGSLDFFIGDNLQQAYFDNISLVEMP
jgi:hypothetical protein